VVLLVMHARVVSRLLWLLVLLLLLLLLLLQVSGLCGIRQSRLLKANGRNTGVLLLPNLPLNGGSFHFMAPRL